MRSTCERRARGDVDAARVGLIGHSEGAAIAAMVAARTSDVAFVVSVAGSAVPYSDLVVTQVERITLAMGGTVEDAERAAEQQRRVVELAEADDWQGLEDFLLELATAQLEDLPDAQRQSLGDLEAIATRQVASQLASLQDPWMRFFLTHDPAGDWQRVSVPVLALFGALDVQVDVEQNLPALEAALARARNDDVTIRVFERANHLFQQARLGGPDEYAAIEMAFVPGFLSEISSWIRARFGAGEG